MKKVSASCTASFRLRGRRHGSGYVSGLKHVILLAVVISATAFAPRQRSLSLRVLVLLAGDSSASRTQSLEGGIMLGAEEAARTMTMFGDSLELRTVRVAGMPAADSVVHAALRSRRAPAAIIRADESACLTPTPAWPALVVDAACTPAALATARQSAVVPNVLFIRPPAAPFATGGLPNDSVALWLASLVRFGAEQLNQRYARRVGRTMDSDAWAGWFAVKGLAEAALRARATTALALAKALTDSTARYDGHKGIPLRFDTRTGVLRQSLYVVARDSAGAERVIREIAPDEP